MDTMASPSLSSPPSRVIARFAPDVTAEDPRLLEAIDAALAA
jgi:hypothetical protein